MPVQMAMAVRDGQDEGKLEVVCYIVEMINMRPENAAAFFKRGKDVAGWLGGCLVQLSEAKAQAIFNAAYLPKCVRTLANMLAAVCRRSIVSTSFCCAPCLGTHCWRKSSASRTTLPIASCASLP